MIKELTYSSYGFPTTKPINLFTNALDFKTKQLDSFGEGAKNKKSKGSLGQSNKQKLK